MPLRRSARARPHARSGLTHNKELKYINTRPEHPQQLAGFEVFPTGRILGVPRGLLSGLE